MNDDNGDEYDDVSKFESKKILYCLRILIYSLKMYQKVWKKKIKLIMMRHKNSF